MTAFRAILACLVFIAPVIVAGAVLEGEPPAIVELIAQPIWLVLVVVIYMRVMRRVERHGWRPLATLAVPYLIATLAGGVLRVGLDVLYRNAPALGSPSQDSLLATAFFGMYSSFGFLGLWMLFYLAPRSIEDSRDRERERQLLLREAERARVRSALEPHFVLNTLNTIAGLVSEEPRLAREMIGDLGDLLRDVVQRSSAATAAVRDEIAWLQRYAKIIEARHPGRLSIAWHLDAAAMGCPMPVMLLQPILENAIQHGALRQPGGGVVDVTIEQAASGLRCTVADNGPGFTGERTGAGLDLTRRRMTLEVHDGRLDVATGPAGTTVTLLLPRAA